MANKLAPGVRAVLCGSYRRGKKDSGDADVLLTHEDPKYAEYLRSGKLMCDVLSGLFLSGFLVHDLHRGKKERERVRPSSEGHTTFMGLCILPKGHPEYSGITRRLDIKTYPVQSYAFALLYFTGSDHFNRSMRYFSKKKGLTLSDHGLCKAMRVKGERIHTGNSFFCQSEKDVFEALGLRYIPPNRRHCYENFVSSSSSS